MDAAEGSASPFDARIHELRGHPGQIAAAAAYRELLADSPINSSHRDCGKVQDPYSLRCQPQVMGACIDQIEAARAVLLREANGVTDNPLVFIAEGEPVEVLSGGNFHAEPVAFAADNLALAVAEIGALSERRIALLIDATLSGLPPFLVSDGGVNSGFMIAHVTAAALASENKLLAHPASVDSLPTSANQEDHVSMATFAARKLGDLCENTAIILAIELLAAAQGVDLRAPHRHLRAAAARDARDPRARAALRHRSLSRARHRRHDRGGQRRRHRRARAQVPAVPIPVEFLLFGATLAGRGDIPSSHAGRSRCSGSPRSRPTSSCSAISTARPGLLGLHWHLQDEWVILANLFALLVGIRAAVAAFRAEPAAARAAARAAG